jgi:hypothetical protein
MLQVPVMENARKRASKPEVFPPDSIEHWWTRNLLINKVFGIAIVNVIVVDEIGGKNPSTARLWYCGWGDTWASHHLVDIAAFVNDDSISPYRMRDTEAHGVL